MNGSPHSLVISANDHRKHQRNFKEREGRLAAMLSGAVPGKFLGIVGQDPSYSKTNRSHVDIFQFCFIHFRYIL